MRVAGAGPVTARKGRTFSADVTARTARDGFDVFRQEWATQVGGDWPLPGPDLGGSDTFQMDARVVPAHDILIADVDITSFSGQMTGVDDADDRVQIHLIEHGEWSFSWPDRLGEAVTVPAGSFIARHDGPPTWFRAAPGTRAKILILPAPVLRPLTRGRQVAGSARTAEVRMLSAHASIVSETAHDLTPAGLHGARDALLQLAKGALSREFDDREPRLAPALARAAMRIADSRLASDDLSPRSLARELHVSVRTLHLAFAAVGESVAAYIRRRRLEEARLELAAPRRSTISEIAARWQFTDSSHFNRAFRKQYGQTPGEFARLSWADRDLPGRWPGSRANALDNLAVTARTRIMGSSFGADLTAYFP